MAINKVTLDSSVLIDLSTDTVSTSDDIALGKVGHLNSGLVVTGTHTSGAILKFDIIGSETQPTVTEKTLWVNTNITLTGKVFSTTLTPIGTTGDIWVLPALINSISIEFYDDIWIRPFIVRVYNGSSWEYFPSKFWDGSSWSETYYNIYDILTIENTSLYPTCGDLINASTSGTVTISDTGFSLAAPAGGTISLRTQYPIWIDSNVNSVSFRYTRSSTRSSSIYAIGFSTSPSVSVYTSLDYYGSTTIAEQKTNATYTYGLTSVPDGYYYAYIIHKSTNASYSFGTTVTRWWLS